jgi:hypothetical protein
MIALRRYFSAEVGGYRIMRDIFSTETGATPVLRFHRNRPSGFNCTVPVWSHLQNWSSAVAASRQCRILLEIEGFGFLPKAATLLLQRFRSKNPY